MANLSAVISADTSKFVNEVKTAKQQLEKFVKETEQASNTAKENASVTNEQVQAYKRVLGQLEKVGSGTLNTKQQQQALTEQIKELKVQWQNLSDSAKSSDFGKTLSDTLQSAKTELNNLKSKLSSVDTKGTLKKQLRETTQELTNLTAKYRAMSAAEKASASGRELAAKMDELREKAGSLTDTIGDVQQEIKVMASDTPNLDVFNDALGIGADLLSTYSSVLAKVTGDENALKNAISTVMTVQSAANLLTKVTNALQSSSALMLKVRQIQEGATAAAINVKTAAEGRSKVATIAATAAQKAFNVVANANPYVLLATAILGVGAALIGFSKHLDESAEAEKRAQEEAEKLKEKQEHLKAQTEELQDTSAKTKVKFFELQEQWKNLKTVAEKKQWITDNQAAFNQLGISVNTVKTAEDIFVNNTDAVVDALMARAIAAKRAEQAANDLIDLDKKRNDEIKKAVGQSLNNIPKKSDRLTDEEARGAGIRTNSERTIGISGAGSYARPNVDNLSEDELNKLSNYRRSQNVKQYNDIYKRFDEEEKIIKDRYKKQIEIVQTSNNKLQSLSDKPTAKGGGGSSNTPNVDKPNFDELNKQIEQLHENFIDSLTIDDNSNIIRVKKSIGEIEDAISAKNKEFKLAISDESRRNIQEEIEILTGQREALELKIKPVVDEDTINSIKNSIAEHNSSKEIPLQINATKAQKAQSNADNLKEELEFQKSIIRNYTDEYKQIQERVQLGATLTDNENSLVGIYDEAIKKVKELSGEYEKAASNARDLDLSSQLKEKTWEGVKSGIDTLGNLESSFFNLGSNWNALTEKWNDMSSLEKVNSVFDTTISTIQSVIQAYESINSIIQLFDAINAASAAKKIATDSQENASEIGKLGVKQAGAMANATASGSKLPFPANIAAIAAGIAAVTAAFASVFSCFADGGIVGGSSTIGDYNIARVNKGEMILNGTQQKRLFNLLDGQGSRNGSTIGEGSNVVFKIKGNDLYGVLSNHTRKGNKIGR